ncbi:MAG: hypothetical protein JNK53_00015 [Phycisphaerae bacterium]|nr:hypothetical protein [Phycisphaerae bacterium]
MNTNRTLHPFPPHREDGAPGPDGTGAGDRELARLVDRLNALGDAYVGESRARGLADRVFSASAPVLDQASPVVARISWARWAAVASVAAVLAVAALVPLGMLPGGGGTDPSRGVETIAFKPGDFAPAGLSERLVIGLYDGDAALASIDLVNGDGAASVVVARVHDADAVASELHSLLAVGSSK